LDRYGYASLFLYCPKEEVLYCIYPRPNGRGVKGGEVWGGGEAGKSGDVPQTKGRGSVKAGEVGECGGVWSFR